MSKALAILLACSLLTSVALASKRKTITKIYNSTNVAVSNDGDTVMVSYVENGKRKSDTFTCRQMGDNSVAQTGSQTIVTMSCQ